MAKNVVVGCVLALALTAGAQAAPGNCVEHSKNCKAARTAPAAQLEAAAVSGVTLNGVTLSGFGLEPGHVYYASFEFVADDGGTGYNLGYSAMTVRADGTVVFENSVADVDPRGVPGTLRAWLRDGAAWADTAATGPDGTVLQTETHLS